MEKETHNLEYFKNILPEFITVLTERTEEGLFAKRHLDIDLRFVGNDDQII